MDNFEPADPRLRILPLDEDRLVTPRERGPGDEHIEFFGPAKSPVLVIDNYLDDPDAVRAFGLAHEYRVPDTYYPGLVAESQMPIRHIAYDVIATFFRKAYGIEGEVVFFPDAEPGVSARFSAVTFGGRAADADRLSEDAENMLSAQSGPHTDTGCLRIVLHLGPQQVDTGATAYWRHRATGLQYFPQLDPIMIERYSRLTGTPMWEQIYDAVLDQPGIFTVNDALRFMGREAYDHDPPLPPFPTESNDLWERVGMVETRYNRLVAFHSWQYHSIVPGDALWPDRLSDARLSLNLSVGACGVFPG